MVAIPETPHGVRGVSVAPAEMDGMGGQGRETRTGKVVTGAGEEPTAF